MVSFSNYSHWFLCSRWKWTTALGEMTCWKCSFATASNDQPSNDGRGKTARRQGTGAKCGERMQVGNHWNYPGCSSLTAAVDTFLTIFFRKLFDLIWQGGDNDEEDTCQFWWWYLFVKFLLKNKHYKQTQDPSDKKTEFAHGVFRDDLLLAFTKTRFQDSPQP